MGRKARDKKTRPGIAASTFSPSTTEPAPARPQVSSGRARHREEALLPPNAARSALVLLAATVVAYLGGLDTPFLLDDPINIAKNTTIQRPLGLFALLSDPRAVVTATLRWNYLTGGLAVAGYHALNIAAHVIAGWMVFLLTWSTLRLPVFASSKLGNTERLAGAAALLFLLHPMQTESVTYVIQRAEIFAAAALVGSLLALVAMKDRVTSRSMALLIGSCVFGTYSKPSFAVVPALLLTFDLCLLSRGRVADLARRWPAYAIASVASMLTFLLTKFGGGFEGNTAGFDMEGITAGGYLSAQFGVIVHYLRVALWPGDLCFDCGYRGPWPVLPTMLGDSVLIPLLILTALVVVGLACWKRNPLVTFAVLASAVVLSPTSSFVPLADFYVEHRMYLPIAFLAMALVPLFYQASTSLGSRMGLSPEVVRIVRRSAGIAVLLALAITTHARNRLLADPIALMEDSLVQAPQNERVHYNLANAFKRLNRFDEAIPHYETAIRLLPNVVRSYQNLGSLYLAQGNLEKALEVYVAGAEAKPEAAMAHRNVAVTCLRLNRPEQALEAAQRAVALDPRNANGRRLQGDALVKLGRRSEAIESWEIGLSANPGDAGLTERLASQGSR